MNTTRIPLADLEQNTGQVPGLPANPRQWTQTSIDRIARSLEETPELFEARPIAVYPYGGKYVILGGNLRYEGCRKNGYADAPCIIVPEGTPVAKLKELVLKDNSSFGSWDYASLREEWDDIDLEDLGIELAAPEDYTSRNTEVDAGAFSDDMTLKLKYDKRSAALVKASLGEDRRETLLNALGYED